MTILKIHLNHFQIQMSCEWRLIWNKQGRIYDIGDEAVNIRDSSYVSPFQRADIVKFNTIGTWVINIKVEHKMTLG